MRASEIFPQIAKEKKVTLEQIAKAMDRLFPSVWRSMKNDNAPMSFFVECAEVLGYEVVIQPKSAGKRKEGSYVVTVESEKQSEKQSKGE